MISDGDESISKVEQSTVRESVRDIVVKLCSIDPSCNLSNRLRFPSNGDLTHKIPSKVKMCVEKISVDLN